MIQTGPTMTDEATLMALAETFKAIADPGRLRIIHALLAEELCVCELSAMVKMTPSAVSHQLRQLRARKLVKRRRAGQKIYYSLDDCHIEAILSQGLEHIQET